MIYPGIPIKALSIMQPWSFLIVHGKKNIENRDWSTKFRGPIAIHAGKKFDDSARFDLELGRHPVTGENSFLGWPGPEDRYALFGGKYNGGIVGVADIVDCVDHSDSDWFVGKYGFILANARPVPFIPVKGALGFFTWRRNLPEAA